MAYIRKIKGIVVNIAILLLSLCICFLIFEMILRFFSHTSLLRVHHYRLFCEYDPLLGWRKIPNTKAVHRETEYSVIECMNSKGIRGPEYSYDKPKGEHRIIILGDSFTEGYTVEFNNLFSEVLKRKLNSKKDIYHEVINAGVGGYSTDQEFLFFQSEGKKYRPDITVLMFVDNDVWYNNRAKFGGRGHKPLFKIVEGELRLTNVPVPKLNGRIRNKKEFVEKVKEWFRAKSYLYNFVVYRVKNVRYLHGLAIRLGLAQDVNVLITDSKRYPNQIITIPDEFRVYNKGYDAEVEKAWKVTKALIVSLKKEAISSGSKLLVFYIPSRAAIYTEEWNAMKRKYGLSNAGWDIDQVGIELENICGNNAIDFINPTDLFKAEPNRLKKKKEEQLYFFLDGHWNVYGHKSAGDILAEYIDTYYLTDDS